MKLKRHFYCITDKNNKPDYRFLFESAEDAAKKIKVLKNTTRGETLILSQNKREFFVDGIKKNFIDPTRKIAVEKGCRTGLRIQKVQMIDNIKPDKMFSYLVKSKENEFSFSREHRVNPQKERAVNIPNEFLSFDWQNTFLRTKSFLGGLSVASTLTILLVFSINNYTSNKVASEVLRSQNQISQKMAVLQTKVLGKKDEQYEVELNKFMVAALKNFDTLKQEELEQEIKKLLAGSPMEQMSPYIAQKDRKVAAFLIGIAKKESNFGRRVPVLNGEDCFNYWGYRGIRPRMGTGGHTCFDSPEDAVNTVATRLENLVNSDVDTPKEMVIWKCGYSCAGHSNYSVEKWIDDVDIYFSKMMEDTVSTS